jgi:photosystem II stability/assembly factor-like uncharacterized protein
MRHLEMKTLRTVIIAVSMIVNSANAQWQQTSGPYGGQVLCMAKNESLLCVGTWGGGVFISRNDGLTWESADSGLPDLHVWSLLIHGDDLFAGSYYQGVFRSTDGGASWHSANTGLTDPMVYALAADGTWIYAGTGGSNGGIFRSTNNGGSWEHVYRDTLTYPHVYSFFVSSSGIMAGGYGVSYFSADHGNSWARITLAPINVVDFEVIGDTWFAVIAWGGGVLKSVGGYSNWSPANNGLTNTSVGSIERDGDSLFISTSRGVFKSTNLGDSWIRQDSVMRGFLVIKNDKMFAGTEDGVFCSTNRGLTWMERSQGIAASLVRSLYVDQSLLIAGSQHSVLSVSSDRGSTWTRRVISSPGREIDGIVVYEGQILAATCGHGILRSSDGGSTWFPSNSGLQNLCTESIVRIDTNLFVGTWTGLYISRNGGSTWEIVLATEGTVYDVTKYDSDLLAASWGGVFRSSDAGSTWVRSDSGMSGCSVTSIVRSGDMVLASTPCAVYKSTDQGWTWTSSSAGLPNNSWIGVLLKVGNCVYVANYLDGVFSSRDDGTTWQSLSGPLPKYVQALAADDSMLYAGTYSSGVWRHPLVSSLVSSVRQEGGAPIAFSLSQNFPNPFNPSTTIRFALPKSGHVELRVYNTLGQEVATLMNEEKNAGTYSAQWNAGSVASGVYFYRLKAGEYTQIRKLLLLK